jgi:RNA polymerase-associated protein RTF1
MPDSDGNFSNNFLELAGATGKKRKHHEGSSKSEAKLWEAVCVVHPCPSTLYQSRCPRSPSMNTTSDFGCEEDDIEENPYPLDGKYVDEYDRQLYTVTFSRCLSSIIDNLTGYWKCQN